ncbi:tRNA (adenosine(37)-N6)-threonylcarbamoyltransferase complex ATPase subunit type 1 TsaE [Carnobacterium divergens]|uniref:tRNA (adenosine(37)-N6)-threonylcarbamoyltransferase complex ATPase subunit type 1 TsaE n=1 Tax=Carnobacterium divergens TaxID=2748 RepID=UPI001071A719|nr:tRNA (adenosine(37)-N6)-threonylcarbamoyltransferase complex ATPase subunit type 1 TsaE [Carnobacterium divergens]MDT1996583.1 tRNA (adenosine(37)-N6)-threonylcarbamoyltransferase complex ATPase subunit type 1 TsaE [Carnobacterium divergens]TFI65766.1 tRNA (adenosine(37)-N6)-threonylcarbamoyltransferase complex ATPase subunit type 1 TsaE [Carnobacterium divergens]TFI65871.1 tRNA (adenosine(37)-N6)-threonylcarbamoyltransferase complex ATPase subunit type 1 TsaE [Carnobacterium divergens]TFI69
MRTKHAKNEAETKEIAKSLADFLKEGSVLLLEGNLGAGKTTFTKGIAEGLGIKEVIKSPTYTLIREYQSGRLPLYHMDVYRLEEVGGDELGLEEYFQGEGVSIVEWATFIPEDLPKEFLKIKLVPMGEDFSERDLVFEPVGAQYEQIVANYFEDK